MSIFKKGVISAHIELNNICNAFCPQCQRNVVNKDNKVISREGLNDSELSLNEYKCIFDKEFYSNFKLHEKLFNGNISEPIASSNILEILDYALHMQDSTFIRIHTNGSLKTKDFWKDLAVTLKNYSHGVTFGLDGLSDTHSHYRINTNFEKIIENAKTFIEYGGGAKWQFIVFEHNEHQIDEARKYAKKIGFKNFETLYTHRFMRDSKKNLTYFLPNNKIFTLKEAKKYEIEKNYKKILQENTNNKTSISCWSKNSNYFYLDYQGNVSPCCFISTSYNFSKKWNNTFDNIIPFYDTNEMNAIKNSLTDILINSSFFKNLETSWSVKPCRTCSVTCGKNTEKIHFGVREKEILTN